MTTKFYCWDIDAGETREDEREVIVVFDDHGDAAESYAERIFDGGDPFDTATIAVRRDGEDEIVVFDVSVEMEPIFSAEEIRRIVSK